MENTGMDVDSFFAPPTETEKKKFVKTPFYRFTKETNSLTLRIAPICRKLRDKGAKINSAYRPTHWGFFKSVEGRDTPIPVPFRCIEQKGNEYYDAQSCPMCDKIKELTESIKERKEEYAKTKSPAEIKELLKPDQEYILQHQVRKEYNYYAKAQDSKWGILKIGYKAHLALQNLQKENMEKRKIDIFAPVNGCWVTLGRQKPANGNFQDTAFTAEILTEELEDGLMRKKIDSLTKLDIEAIQELPELYDQGGIMLAASEIETLIKSDGDIDVSTTIFNKPREVSAKKERSSKTAAELALKTADMIKATVKAKATIQQPVAPVEKADDMPNAIEKKTFTDIFGDDE